MRRRFQSRGAVVAQQTEGLGVDAAQLGCVAGVGFWGKVCAGDGACAAVDDEAGLDGGFGVHGAGCGRYLGVARRSLKYSSR